MAVYEVSQVTAYLKDVLEMDHVLRDVWVSGEVANLARPGSGHSYFSLRDGRATIRCVMFRGSRGAEKLDDGAAVIAHGRFSVYEVRGDLQMIVDIVQPEGVGELQLKLEQLKLKLENEGLFDPSRKRDLPAFPQRIGVITSPTGAVWHDIQTVIARRFPLVELILAAAPVQGDTAAPGIVDAFRALSDEPNVDLIIMGRGGGSLEDLWPFNEEAVARAIYTSKVPVISAVGHETDFTIADMVADHRAPTPSAAAEMAVPDRMELLMAVSEAARSMDVDISARLSSFSDGLRELHSRLARSKPNLDTLRLRIDDLLREAATHIRHNMELSAERVASLNAQLESLSPKDTLRRGYAIVESVASGAIVESSDQVKSGDSVRVTLSRGGFEADVTSTADPES